MATMDARLILAGQAPDVAGSAMRGAGLAQMVNDTRRSNALAQLYQDQGAAMLAGDGNALNALAGYDPAAAMGLRTTLNAENRAAENHKIAIARAVAQMSEAEAAAESAAYAKALEAATVIQTPEQWDAFMGSKGLEDLIGQFENKDLVIAEAIGIKALLDAKAGMQPETPDVPASFIALQMRAAEAGLKPGTSEYQQFMANGGKPPSGMLLETGPDGTVRFVQGDGVTGERPSSYTDAQSKNIIYYTRAEGALADFEPVASALADPKNAVGGAVPLAGNYLVSPEYQQAETAGKEFLAAILRKDTGAAITAQEMDEYGAVYFPRPGDTEVVLEQKRRARARAMEALRAGMGAKEIVALEQAGTPARQDTPGVASVSGAAPNEIATMTPQQILTLDTANLTKEQEDALNKRLEELGY